MIPCHGLRLQNALSPPASASVPLVERLVRGLWRRVELPAVELALQVDQRLVLGRHDAADLSFDDVQVSRLHGVLAARSID